MYSSVTCKWSLVIFLLASVEDLPATGNKAGVKGAGAKQPQAAAAAAGGAGLSDADADLEARLENLRRQWPSGAFGVEGTFVMV